MGDTTKADNKRFIMDVLNGKIDGTIIAVTKERIVFKMGGDDDKNVNDLATFEQVSLAGYKFIREAMNGDASILIVADCLFDIIIEENGYKKEE